MRHSNFSRYCCCCCCCCCCYYWVIILLVASSVVHVSPEISRAPITSNMCKHQKLSSTSTKSISRTTNFNNNNNQNNNNDNDVFTKRVKTFVNPNSAATEVMTIMMELPTIAMDEGNSARTTTITTTTRTKTILPQTGANADVTDAGEIALSMNVRRHTTTSKIEMVQNQQKPTITTTTSLGTATTTTNETPTIKEAKVMTPEHNTNNITNTLFTSHQASNLWRKFMLEKQQKQQLERLSSVQYNGHRLPRQAPVADMDQIEKCRLFSEGDPKKYEFYSPDYPNHYPKNINCTHTIIAPKGQIIRLDFRNSFHIEAKEECKFDFLEIRDGQYGFSTLIGKFCGTDFPPVITSKERYLWLHFHSDESIEYSGFTAVYEFIDRNRETPSTDLNCTIYIEGLHEGLINSSQVPSDIRDAVNKNKVPLDCMWRIQVPDKWKIQVKFLEFKLSKPNDCDLNYLDIFPEETLMHLRMKNFCGSAGESITSDSNIINIRFYTEQIAINSTFLILFTAFRDRGNFCTEDEFDCEDATCISLTLKCNGNDNCKFRWDEDEGTCKLNRSSEDQSEHVNIIIGVFGTILGGMVLTFLVNCVRKIMRDQKIIREHIRQSKESKLNEMGRNSKARSRENINAVISPRQKHSQTSLQILDDVSNRYYREVIPLSVQTSKADLKVEKEHHHHDMIVQTSLCADDDFSTTTTVAPTACDMGCQTRESLFAPTFMRQKSVASTISKGGGGSAVPRFSTFGYDAQQQQSLASPPVTAITTDAHHHLMEAEHPPLHRPQEVCQHHHHHHHLHQQQQPQQHQQQYQQQQNMTSTNQALPQYGGQRSYHRHQQQYPQQTTTTTGTMKSTAVLPSIGKNKQASQQQQQKLDESKAFIDIRNSAPDVIIMTSH